MKTFKSWALSLIPAAMSLGIVTTDAAAQPAPPLTVQVYNADAASFNVNAVLVSGATDAVLLDTGFTRADAHRIAAMVLDSKKKLTTIYISQADPDFYFGAEVLKQVFPEAKLVASAQAARGCGIASAFGANCHKAMRRRHVAFAAPPDRSIQRSAPRPRA